MINVISRFSIDGVASTYIGYVRNNNKNLIEFVDSTPPPQSNRIKKWVIILSSQIGCPLGCKFCDASGYFIDNLSREEIISQVQYILDSNKEYDPQNTEKFKIQFARMGEPSLNPAVIDAMLELRERYPRYIPCIATTAPAKSIEFFERLIDIRDIFSDFQLQFSINSTNIAIRDRIMPFKKLPLQWIAEYSERFHSDGKRKVVLNFALDTTSRIDYKLIESLFNPKKNIIKLTPINPTRNARLNNFGIKTEYEEINAYLKIHSEKFRECGFESIISIGDIRENIVLSNCGQIANIYYENNTESLSSITGESI